MAMTPGDLGIAAARQDAARETTKVSDTRLGDIAWAINEYGQLAELTTDELFEAIRLMEAREWGFTIYTLYDTDKKPVSYGIKRE